jgi:hypothetical protein
MPKRKGLTPLQLVKHEGRDPPDESAPTTPMTPQQLEEAVKPLSRNMKTLMENRAKAHQPAESWGNPPEETPVINQDKLSALIASKQTPPNSDGSKVLSGIMQDNLAKTTPLQEKQARMIAKLKSDTNPALRDGLTDLLTGPEPSPQEQEAMAEEMARQLASLRNRDK